MLLLSVHEDFQRRVRNRALLRAAVQLDEIPPSRPKWVEEIHLRDTQKMDASQVDEWNKFVDDMNRYRWRMRLAEVVSREGIPSSLLSQVAADLAGTGCTIDDKGALVGFDNKAADESIEKHWNTSATG